MTDNPYQDTAKDFLNLWQKQMTSVMGDKQFIHAMLELFQNMQTQPNAKQNAKSSSTTSNPTDAPAAEHGLLDQLAFRVAMCEKRLAALEAKKPAAKPAVRRAAKRGLAKSNSARGKKPNN
ncbi:MAG: hypothetical protein ABL857_03910 [Rickettsiales bacterium]|jgi:hypothetical protein